MIQDFTKQTSYFGEIFITSDEVEGSLENLRHFRGKLIQNISGGNKKVINILIFLVICY